MRGMWMALGAAMLVAACAAPPDVPTAQTNREGDNVHVRHEVDCTLSSFSCENRFEAWSTLGPAGARAPVTEMKLSWAFRDGEVGNKVCRNTAHCTETMTTRFLGLGRAVACVKVVATNSKGSWSNSVVQEPGACRL
jgi:hypothetical protein